MAYDARFQGRLRGSALKWVAVILGMMMLFAVLVAALLLRHYTMRETVIVSKYIINESGVLEAERRFGSSAASMASSEISRHSSALSQRSSLASSSLASSSLKSLISQYENMLSSESKASSSSLQAATTTMNLDYTSYRIKVPTKFKECRPIKTILVDGTVLEADTCLAINASCCPCSTIGMVDGRLKTVGWGGSIDFINARYYKNGNSTEPDYFEDYLKSCTGFGVVCRRASSPTGCNYEAECINGRCQAASRF